MATQTEVNTKVVNEVNKFNYIWTPPSNIKIQNVKLSNLVSCCAIDISGSTGYGSMYNRKKILTNEIDVAKQLGKNTKFIAWDTNAQVVNNLNSLGSRGGTSPACIYENHHTQAVVQESKVLWLLTDGQIGQNEVNRHAQAVNANCNNLNMSIGILFLSNNDFPNKPSGVNVSVLSSAMVNNAMILIWRSELDGFNLLWACGETSGQLPYIEISNDTEWLDLPLIKMENLNNLTVSVSNMQVPNGFMRMSNGMYLSVDNLIDITSNNTLSLTELQELPWQDILRLCRDRNLLNNLRQWLKQNELKIMEELNNSNKADVVENQHAQRLLNQLNQAMKDNNTELVKSLREEFVKVRNQAWEQQDRIQQEINKKLKPVKQFFENLYATMHDLQQASYSVTSMNINLQSNRAKRATQADQVDHSTVNNLNYTNCYLSECPICLEEETPICILMRNHQEPSQNTNDFSLNWPLACGKQNIQVLSPYTCCVRCAQYFINRQEDGVRVPINHILPIVSMQYPENRQYIHNVLANSLTAGVNVNGLFLFLFGIMSEVQRFEWGQDESWMDITKYMKEQLLDHTHTTDTFTEEGTRMTLRKALPAVLMGEYVFRQPLNSVNVILLNCKEFNLLQVGDTVFHYSGIIRGSIVRLVVMLYLKNKLNNTTQPLLNCINQDLFELVNDVPQYCTTRACSITNSKFMKQLMGDNWNLVLRDLVKLCEYVGTTLNDVMTNANFTTLLWCVLNHLEYLPHQKLEDMMRTLGKQFKLFNNLVDNQINKVNPVTDTTIIEHINQAMFPHKTIPDDHLKSPSFVTLYGPSVIFCTCGTSFMNLSPGTYSIDDVVVHLKKNRLDHFNKVYGSEYPNSTSAHINLHRTTRDVINEDFPNSTEPSDEINKAVFDKIISTKGQKGNIYKGYIMTDVIDCVKSYFEIKNKCSYKYDVNTDYTMRLKLELVELGMLDNINNDTLTIQ